MPGIRKRLLYFNIEYDCNNDCIFCAAGSKETRKNRGRMSAFQVSMSLDKWTAGKEDIVVINGGEPTVHPEIIPILENASSRGSFVYLFSNGLKFSEPSFAHSIVATRVSCIAIPIYSHIADTHDFITQCKGSFVDTIRGINNLFSAREQTRQHLEIELKSLASKVNFNHLPYVARMVVEEFPKTDHFLLSSMYVSNAVVSSQDTIVPRLSSCASVIRQSIDVAVEGGIDVCLYYIPLCILKDEKYAILCNKDKYRSDKDPDVYFDPFAPHGIKLDKDSTKGKNCFRCSFDSKCDGFWKSYSDRFGFDDLRPMT